MIFVFDLDGTICFKGRPLSKEVVRALDFCQQKGHQIVFASARPIRDIFPVLPESMHRHPMVGGNGTFVAKEGQMIDVTPLEEQSVQRIRQLIDEFELAYLVDGRWDYAYTGSEEHPIYRNIDPERRASHVAIDQLGEIVKAVLFPEDKEETLLHHLGELPVQLYQHQREGIIDICPQGTDKWQGLKKLGVQEETFIAFGNDANDVAMFQHAKESVCVGDHEALCAMASVHVEADESKVVEMIVSMSEKYA